MKSSTHNLLMLEIQENSVSKDENIIFKSIITRQRISNYQSPHISEIRQHVICQDNMPAISDKHKHPLYKNIIAVIHECFFTTSNSLYVCSVNRAYQHPQSHPNHFHCLFTVCQMSALINEALLLDSCYPINRSHNPLKAQLANLFSASIFIPHFSVSFQLFRSRYNKRIEMRNRFNIAQCIWRVVYIHGLSAPRGL